MHTRRVLTILLAGIWINASEFLRNEVLLKHLWVEHFASLGMAFPSAPVNGLVWVIWGFVFAGVIYVLSRRFSLVETACIGWVVGFVMMWLVVGNLAVLPMGLLVYAIPLSLLESALAAYICHRMPPA